MKYLTEGKHWPEDYVKTAYNTIKQSVLGQQSWYKDEYVIRDLVGPEEGALHDINHIDKNDLVRNPASYGILGDFVPLMHKNSNLGFFAAVIRWFVEYAGSSQQKYQEFIERKLGNVIKTLLKICNDKSYDSQREVIKKMTFNQFEKLANQVNAKTSSEDIQTTKRKAPYKVIPIYSYEELNKKYGGTVTGYKGQSEWCHTNGQSTYESWTKNGTQMFFVIQQDGWEKIQPPDPETTSCYDAYGMSLIAILVNVWTNMLLNSTSRWNHIILPNTGSADTMFESWQQLNRAVGLDVESICRDECKQLKAGFEKKIENANLEVESILKQVNVIDENTIPKSLRTLVTRIEIPSNVKVIEQHAFDKCSNLVKVTIPDSVTGIGYSAFSYCSGLTSVMIPDNVTSIEGDAFYNCTSLTSVSIPDGVTSIGYGAFSGCIRLKSMTIPDSVTSIKFVAFYDCTNLKSLIFKGKTLEEVKSMENYPWGIKDTSVIRVEKSMNESRHNLMVHYWAHMLDECFNK